MGTFNRMHLIRQVDLLTLRLFLSAVEEKQIGLAAIRENVSASTATKRIHDLEHIAGLELLERTPRGVVPTPAGTVLARHVRKIFGSLEDIRSEIAAFTEGMQGDLTVASAQSIIAPFLARELGEFGRQYPKVRLIVHEIENREIVQEVARGEADLGLFAAAHELDLTGVDVTPYRRDRIVVALPRDHRLADRLSVTFEELLPENVIAVGPMVNAFRAAARRLGREFEPGQSVRTGGVALSLVRAGLGVTAQPESLVGREFLDGIAVVELAEPWAERKVHLATAAGRRPGPACRALMEQLLDRPADDPS
ncbi:LysR family transcriptional regulator [Amycolatopsis australiensis]|uniref:DNA-binding transcriptional regulator, LysR family n=1 Tax=Amycolatopsis australiensis TaxID=546364 RepID=A0A1K1SXQ6_9PSEU|nr:LysR family transcriptional regulator [Amycolatopsis australiensis]SFW88645.1 DNA-binding transcriptional regulator, LysR family [Amycolatopsis australiensis]